MKIFPDALNCAHNGVMDNAASSTCHAQPFLFGKKGSGFSSLAAMPRNLYQQAETAF